VTGATTLVTAPATGATVLVTGATTLVIVPTAGATVPVTAPVTGAAADAVETAAEATGAVALAAKVTGSTVLVTEATAPVTGAAADSVEAAAEATGAAAAVAAEVTGATADVTDAALEVTGAAAEATGDAAEVAASVTGAAAEVTEVAAEGSEPVPLLVTEVTVPDPVPVPEPLPLGAEDVLEAAEVTGAAAEVVPEAVPVPALVPVAAEVTVDTAEVTGAVAEVALDPELARRLVGLVAAFACREKTSKTTRIPAAAIAICIARRAMDRMIGCGISSSPLPGQTPSCPSSATRNTRVSRNSGPFLSANPPETDIAVRPRMYILVGHHRTELAWARAGTADPR
jgi:hypothetical protein